MKAITVLQPWASLIAAGIKTIETRPRSTSYRGRVAIHAGKAKPEQGAIIDQHIVDWGLAPALTAATSGTPHMGDGCGFIVLDDELNSTPLPLGAVVASAVLADCVPIIDRWGGGHDDGGWAVVVEDDRRLRLVGRGDVSDQLPYGDFTPGRWALLLDDIKPTTERCPWCWQHPLPADQRSLAVPCDVCEGTGRCAPIPAKGQRAVPWEWTP